MQDWYLKYQLTRRGWRVGGRLGRRLRQKQYQVTVDPVKLRAYNLPLAQVSMAIERSNGEVGGRSIEMAEREFILRVKGYIQSLDDLRKVAVGVGRRRRAHPAAGRGDRPIRARHAARHRRTQRRRAKPSAASSWCVTARMRAQVIQDVKQRLDQAMKALPPDVHYTHRLRPQRAD